MIRDIRTVMWKEWVGLFRWGGSRIRAVLTLFAVLTSTLAVLSFRRRL